MIRVTSPRYMKLRDWSDQIVYDLSSYGNFGRLLDDNKWQDWAVQFFNTTSLGVGNLNPYEFEDWKDWAERFCQTIG
jgi:hypothetical protein